MICSLKLNFEPVVIPSSATNETHFVVISLTRNTCEPLFAMIINLNLPGLNSSGFCTIHSYTFYISCVRLVNVLSKFIPQE